MKTIDAVCANCSNSFAARSAKQKFCSRSCQSHFTNAKHRKDTCAHGHAFTPENTLLKKSRKIKTDGTVMMERRCRECERLRVAASYRVDIEVSRRRARVKAHARYHKDIERSRSEQRAYYHRDVEAARLRSRMHYRKHKPTPAAAYVRPKGPDWYERIRMAIPVRLPADIWDDVLADMSMAFIEGRLPIEEIERAAPTFVRAAQRIALGPWGTISLDAPLTNGGTLLDSVKNEDRLWA